MKKCREYLTIILRARVANEGRNAELAVIISHRTSMSRIIVLLKPIKKYF